MPTNVDPEWVVDLADFVSKHRRVYMYTQPGMGSFRVLTRAIESTQETVTIVTTPMLTKSLSAQLENDKIDPFRYVIVTPFAAQPRAKCGTDVAILYSVHLTYGSMMCKRVSDYVKGCEKVWVQSDHRAYIKSQPQLDDDEEKSYFKNYIKPYATDLSLISPKWDIVTLTVAGVTKQEA